jgi:hypothetical protein
MTAEVAKRSFFLRAVIPAAIVFVLCWVIVVLYWQSAAREPNGGDIALYMIGLPAGLIISYLVFKKSIDFTRNKITTSAESKAVAANAATASDVVQNDTPSKDPALSFRIRLQASALRLPAGSEAAEIIAAMMDGVSPDLHPSLKDDDGLPVFAAEVSDLDSNETLESLQIKFADDEEQMTSIKEMPIELLRALTLADQVIAEILADVPPPEAPVHVYGAQNTVPPAFLIIHAMLPDYWSTEHRQIAGAWLQSRVEALGWLPENIQLNNMACRHDAEPLELVDALCLQVNRRRNLDRQLVLACDSYIGENQLARWESKARLSSPKNPEGQIMGEGAAALLLSAMTAPPEAGIEFHRMAYGERSKPAGANGGNSTALLKTLCERAIAVSEIEPENIVYVLSDADQRPSRVVELSSVIHQCLNELDISKQCLSLSSACGYSGATAIVAALGIAGVLAEEEQKPVLVASVLDPIKRGAMIVKAIAVPSPDAEENYAA